MDQIKGIIAFGIVLLVGLYFVYHGEALVKTVNSKIETLEASLDNAFEVD